MHRSGTSLTIRITGLGSGADPDPGIGVAACLRDGFPEAKLVGHEHSYRAAGLHLPVFDQVSVRRPWSELSLDDLAVEYDDYLTGGHLVISTIDLEVYWLASRLGHRWGLLVPPVRAFKACVKPLHGAAESLGFHIPETILLDASQSAVHAFLRQHGPRTWLKGAYAKATRVPCWEALPAAIAQLRRSGAAGPLHLQRDVQGLHEAIAFGAYEGRLLDAVHIAKHEMTAEGKTLSGTRRVLAEDLAVRLRRFVGATDWHGGGELELIREAITDRLWLVDVNPRFPAWIHGGALLGVNLPARLIEAATGLESRSPVRHHGFVRVHTTVPLRADGRLVPPLVLDPDEPLDANKHGVSLRQIAARVDTAIGLPKSVSRGTEDDRLPRVGHQASELDQQALVTVDTPTLVLLGEAMRARFDQLARWHGRSADGIVRTVAYSVKTNPDPRILSQAHKAGLWAEVISVAELVAAGRVGFERNRLIFNGPSKAMIGRTRLIDASGSGVAASYGIDSVEELTRLLSLGLPASFYASTTLALRLRPGRVWSRFGIDLDDFDRRQRLVEAMLGAPPFARFGIHIHIATAAIGRERWRVMQLDQMHTAKELFEATQRACVSVNIGGGGWPEEIDEDFAWLDNVLAPHLRLHLPAAERLIVEPGRAVAQDLVALVTSVIELRRTERGREFVVDASIAEMPEADHFPHRVLVQTPGGWAPVVSPGEDRVLGCTCMEADILATNMRFPDCIQPGDRIVFLDVGAYDRSLSYDFARG